MSIFQNKKEKGFLGESFAVSYLMSKEYRVLERNLSEMYGEVDIVALKDGVFHFIEVKSSFNKKENRDWSLEERVNKKKIEKISKVVSYYLERKGEESCSWCIDIITVYFSPRGDFLDLEMMENVVL